MISSSSNKKKAAHKEKLTHNKNRNKNKDEDMPVVVRYDTFLLFSCCFVCVIHVLPLLFTHFWFHKCRLFWVPEQLCWGSSVQPWEHILRFRKSWRSTKMVKHRKCVIYAGASSRRYGLHGVVSLRLFFFIDLVNFPLRESFWMLKVHFLSFIHRECVETWSKQFNSICRL